MSNRSQVTEKKVWVGLSGGVDSSVSAALLKDAGYQVTGAFIDIWHPEFTECPSVEDRRDAMKTAAELGIDFVEVDCRREYKQRVVDHMVEAYRCGFTPNPDVMCNSFVKFGVFFHQARQQGADLVATGHYAQIENAAGDHLLKEGVDPEKDQSYFLWRVAKQTLSSLLFPVGGYHKKQVRELAVKYGLSAADRPDSQGVCFLGPVAMKDFLKKYLPEQQGDVRDISGEVIGHHQGVWFYTLGQRHGFVIDRKTPQTPPMYVVAKNISSNILVVSPDINDAVARQAVLGDTNWLSEPREGVAYTARVRYRGKKFPCVLKPDGVNVVAEFTAECPLLVAGQSLVLYNDDICLGGGVIDSVK